MHYLFNELGNTQTHIITHIIIWYKRVLMHWVTQSITHKKRRWMDVNT